MKLHEYFVYRYDYGFGIHDYRLQNWFKLALVVLSCLALSYGGWRLWNYANDSYTCSPPYHLVYTGTAPVLVGKIVVTENQYECTT